METPLLNAENISYLLSSSSVAGMAAGSGTTSDHLILQFTRASLGG
jgi:hypothetical protein